MRWQASDSCYVDDSVHDCDQTYSIELDPSSTGDADYGSLSMVVISAKNLDNETRPLPSDSIYVWDISFDQRTRGKNASLKVFVDVNHDLDGLASESDLAAANATVSVDLYTTAGTYIDTLTGTTNADGVFESDWIHVEKGVTYRAEVVDLAHATLGWGDRLGPTSEDDDYDRDGLPDDVFAVL